jgi:hypothetical protein
MDFAHASAELYDPASGTFTPTGNLTAARERHTATLLQDGRVLIAGGWIYSGDPASAELYDPASGTFTPTGNMTAARVYHTATLLPDGRVLIAGGFYSGDGGGGVVLASAELYDPASGTFTPTGAMTAARAGHTATLLPNGRVLIVGGVSGEATAEIYDPASGTFTPTGAMTAVHADHTATLLQDGRVLVAGGYSSDDINVAGVSLASAELYDPASGTFTPTGNLTAARERYTATLLQDGRVLIAGGVTGGPSSGYAELASAEFFQ